MALALADPVQSRLRLSALPAQPYALGAGKNRIASVSSNGAASRTLTYDAAGNTTDAKGGATTTYTYNNAGELGWLQVGTSWRGPYLYNAFGLLTSRQVTAGVPASAIHMIYGRDGNLLAEADPTTGLSMREYIWLQGRPIAPITDADTASPILYHVHVDQLDRRRFCPQATSLTTH